MLPLSRIFLNEKVPDFLPYPRSGFAKCFLFSNPYPLLRIPFADTRRKFLCQDYCRYSATKPIASPTLPLQPSVNPDEVCLADAPLDSFFPPISNVG